MTFHTLFFFFYFFTNNDNNNLEIINNNNADFESPWQPVVEYKAIKKGAYKRHYLSGLQMHY